MIGRLITAEAPDEKRDNLEDSFSFHESKPMRSRNARTICKENCCFFTRGSRYDRMRNASPGKAIHSNVKLCSQNRWVKKLKSRNPLPRVRCSVSQRWRTLSSSCADLRPEISPRSPGQPSTTSSADRPRVRGRLGRRRARIPPTRLRRKLLPQLANQKAQSG